MRKRGWQLDIEWLKRKWPMFAVGVQGNEFILSLWFVDISIWKY
jgi:hypothetical protein